MRSVVMGSSPCLGGRAHRGRPMATGEAGARRAAHPTGLKGTGRRRAGCFLRSRSAREECGRDRGPQAACRLGWCRRGRNCPTAVAPHGVPARSATPEDGSWSAESGKSERSPTGRLRRAQGHRVIPLSGAGLFDWLPSVGTALDGRSRPLHPPKAKPRRTKVKAMSGKAFPADSLAIWW
jgi:hypothetical protein